MSKGDSYTGHPSEFHLLIKKRKKKGDRIVNMIALPARERAFRCLLGESFPLPLFDSTYYLTGKSSESIGMLDENFLEKDPNMSTIAFHIIPRANDRCKNEATRGRREG